MMMYDVILMLIFMFIIDGDSSEGEPRHAIRCKYTAPGERTSRGMPRLRLRENRYPEGANVYVSASFSQGTASSSLCQ